MPKNLPDVTAPSVPEDQEFDIVLGTLLDDDGNPAEVDGPPTASASDDKSTVTSSSDGMTITVRMTDSAKSGDTATVAISVPSEGDTVNQNVLVPLSAGGVASLGLNFGAARPRSDGGGAPTAKHKGKR